MDFQAINTTPENSHAEKVNKAIEYNHPAEQAYRDGQKNRAAKKVAEVEYEKRELVDGDSTYIVEDREDGAYVIAKQKEDQEPQVFGERGLKLDEVPESAVDKDIMDHVGDIAQGTAEAVEGGLGGVGLGTIRFGMNVARSLVDNPVGDFALGEDTVQEFEDWTKDFMSRQEVETRKSAFSGEEFGTAGQIAVTGGDVVGQYVAPAGAAYKVFRAMGAAPLVASVIADGSVGMFGVSPDEENIANLIPEDSEAFGALRDLIATDPEDGEWVNRARNAGEAMAVLGIGEGVIKGLVNMVGEAKKASKAIELPEKIGKAMDKNIDKVIALGATGTLAADSVEASKGASTQVDKEKVIEGDDRFGNAMVWLNHAEGGFADVAGDRGGATQSGISSKVFPKEFKQLQNILKTKGPEAGEKFKAKFYKKEFWDKVVTDDMNEREAAVIFDAAVHHGPGTAKRLWDRAGGKVNRFLDIRKQYMKDIIDADPTQEQFRDGWMNRIQGLRDVTTTQPFDVAGGDGQELLQEQEGRLQLAGLGSKLIKGGVKALSDQTVERAGKVLGEIERIAPADVVLQAQQAIAKTGKAEGIDFNLSKMETPDQLNNFIDEISTLYKDPIDKIKGGVQTFDETQAKADLSRKMGFDVDEVINRQGGELWPAHKIKAARDIFVGELEKTEDLARAIKDGENTSQNMIDFRRQLSVVSAVQSQIKGVQTETARALSQYRMTAKSPMEMQVNLAEMIQKSGGADTNEALVDAYLNVIENGGPEAGAIFARNADQVNGMDMLFEAWINSLLGSPATHAVNMLGNTLTMKQAIGERYLAATYGAAERAGQKLVRGESEAAGITYKEANALAQGFAMSTKDAMGAFYKALKTGETSDHFGKIDYDSRSITSKNVNELPLAKTITSKFLKGDELVKSNGQLAHMIDYMGEYYFRLPGRFLMAEDELFKTMNYRAELHAQAAREAYETGLSDPTKAQARLNDILEDPQLNAPEIHQRALAFSRDQTYTAPAGPIAEKLKRTLDATKIGNFPAGRVVVPFFNVINNITKYTTGRVPGLAVLNPNSKTSQDLFSGDAALRQLTMGKWASGGSLIGLGAWATMNGSCTGRITDNYRMVSQIEKGQGKKRYSCRLPGSDQMISYNRLDPAGMLMAIGSDVSTAMAYVDDEKERDNLALLAVSAIVPYMQDKAFFGNIAGFFEALNPQYGDDKQRANAMKRYFGNILSSGAGAVAGPLAPGTPLQRNLKKNVFMDNAKKITEANKWSIEKDKYGDDVLIAEGQSYRMLQRALNKIYSATPGLGADLPTDVNIWGDEIIYEGGLGPDLVTPIYTHTLKYDAEALKEHNFPAQIEAGRFFDMKVGYDLTIDQHKKFVEIVGIDGELERLNMPLNKPRRQISARANGKNIGLSVDMNPADHVDFIKMMNGIRVPNEAHPDRKRMSMKETLNWMIKEPEYAKLPDDRDASGAKGDLIRKVYNEYKGAAVELFFAQHPQGQVYFRKSVEMKQKAQNTGVQ